MPQDLGRTPAGVATTQAALGRALLDLTREAPEAARRVVTVSPDVSSSTNLGGWVNKVGVWSAAERTDWFADDAETILHWREKPTGQHIELGIAETNLVGLLGELGATWSRWGQPLLPIGVLYDPFVERALEPWSFGIYAGGQSILVGTPSGVSLAPEGGAHQSITTPSIGIEQPGCVTYEPAFAVDTEWCLLASLARLGRPDGSSAYLRLSTRPVNQKLAAIPADPAARERRRRQVVAGAYPLRRAATGADAGPAVTIAVMGAVVPEALAAAERLAETGHAGRRGLRDQPRAAVPRAARPAGPGAGRRPASPGSSTRRSPRPAPRRWSPSWTGTRTRCRSWPPSTGCRTPRWAWRSSASPGRSRTCTATTASTPTASSAPPWTWSPNRAAPRGPFASGPFARAPFRPRGPFARAVMPTRPLMPVCAMRRQTEKIVVDRGYAVDPVHHRPPNQPRSLNQPRKESL